MDSHKRRLVDELLRLSRSELEDVIDEVRKRETTEELGVAALAQALDQRAVQGPFFFAPSDDEE
ncbi:MAG TPA: hypothetical protein VGF65_09195 [Mycobacterium sp.]|jgi:hypothetical protein